MEQLPRSLNRMVAGPEHAIAVEQKRKTALHVSGGRSAAGLTLEQDVPQAAHHRLVDAKGHRLPTRRRDARPPGEPQRQRGRQEER